MDKIAGISLILGFFSYLFASDITKKFKLSYNLFCILLILSGGLYIDPVTDKFKHVYLPNFPIKKSQIL